MSKFVVMLENGTREQQNAITEIFKLKGWDLWHRMEGIWLLSGIPENITSREIAEEITQTSSIGPKIKLVLKIPDTAQMTYWGNAPKEGWEWMAKFWGKVG